MKAAQIMNAEFESYHGVTFFKEPSIFKTVASRISEKLVEKIDIKVLLCLVRIRTYIRLRNLNQQLYEERKKGKEEKRMKNFTNCK